MSNKTLVVGGFAVFVTMIVVTAVLATSYTALASSLQAINPVASSPPLQ